MFPVVVCPMSGIIDSEEEMITYTVEYNLSKLKTLAIGMKGKFRFREVNFWIEEAL